MCVGERIGHLPQHVGDAGCGDHPAVLEDRLERASLDVLHRQIEAVLRLSRVVHRNDVRVVELRGGLRLAQEVLERVLALSHLLGEHLERDVPVEDGVAGEVDDPHPAPSELAQDAVAPLRVGRAAGRCGLLGALLVPGLLRLFETLGHVAEVIVEREDPLVHVDRRHEVAVLLVDLRELVVQVERLTRDRTLAERLLELLHRETDHSLASEQAPEKGRRVREPLVLRLDPLQKTDRGIVTADLRVERSGLEIETRALEEIGRTGPVPRLLRALGRLLETPGPFVGGRGAIEGARRPEHLGRLRRVAPLLVALPRLVVLLELAVEVRRSGVFLGPLEQRRGLHVLALIAEVLAPQSGGSGFVPRALERLGRPFRLPGALEELGGPVVLPLREGQVPGIAVGAGPDEQQLRLLEAFETDEELGRLGGELADLLLALGALAGETGSLLVEDRHETLRGLGVAARAQEGLGGLTVEADLEVAATGLQVVSRTLQHLRGHGLLVDLDVATRRVGEALELRIDGPGLLPPLGLLVELRRLDEPVLVVEHLGGSNEVLRFEEDLGSLVAEPLREQEDPSLLGTLFGLDQGRHLAEPPKLTARAADLGGAVPFRRGRRRWRTAAPQGRRGDERDHAQEGQRGSDVLVAENLRRALRGQGERTSQQSLRLERPEPELGPERPGTILAAQPGVETQTAPHQQR